MSARTYAGASSTKKPNLPFSAEEIEELSKPKVLIAGGGLGGLTLGLLLHKANISFEIFKRAKEIKPLGSVMSMSTNIGPLFKQPGIWDDFVALGNQYIAMHVYSQDMQPVFSMEFEWTEEVRYKTYAISRPDLYDLLWCHIPRERIHLGKRVLSFQQDDNGMKIQCSDNQTHRGNILVGSDGAYSAVRQYMYKELRVLKKLPASDGVSLPFNCVCLVGQTVPLDPEEFPGVGLPTRNGVSVLGLDSRCTMNPSDGVGAIMAMHDAVMLANWINTFRLADVKKMEGVWKNYHAERHPVAMASFKSITRAFMKCIPDWLWKKMGSQITKSRYQASFLPPIEDTGKVKPLHQPSLYKTRAILKHQTDNRAKEEVENRAVVSV